MTATAEKLDVLARHGRAAAAESVYVPDVSEPSLGDPEIQRKRRIMYGGQLTPQAITQLRWYPADVETAMRRADVGDPSMAARMWSAAHHDGVMRGVLSTRTDGLVRLPKAFSGDDKLVAELQDPTAGIRSQFDEMFPPAELAQLVDDGLGLGVGVAELVPVKDREFPVMIRLEPEFLRWRQSEGRWYYLSSTGQLPITPGDGRWILHQPGGRVNPWRSGLWAAVGEPWIRKSHACAYDNNWIAKLANPARVAYSATGATEGQRQGFFRQLMAWGLNTVFGLPPGWDVKLLEGSGRGSESFDRTVKRSEREMIIAIAGQEITTDGGSGFQNNDIHQTIRADLIQATAESLAYTINTQGLPPWVFARGGEEALQESVLVSWDVTPPEDRKALADAYRTFGFAVREIAPQLATYDLELDVRKVADRFGMPVREAPEALETLKRAAEALAGAEGEKREDE